MAIKNTVNIFLAGGNGRMGKEIIRAVVADTDFILVGASDHPDSPVLGADAGLNAGTRQLSVSLTHDLKRQLEKTKGVLIDFSTTETTLENIKRAMQYNIPIVIGTTGFTAEQKAVIAEASKKIPVVFAPNMSVAMNVLFQVVAQAAKALGLDYDTEIFEAHHRNKVDAPSGTAMHIAEVVCKASDKPFPASLKIGRNGNIGPREKGEVGMQVLRGGDIVGEHAVYFCGDGERLEIRHNATNRNTFAAGALRAAKWVKDKSAGLYDMGHVLGLK